MRDATNLANDQTLVTNSPPMPVVRERGQIDAPPPCNEARGQRRSRRSTIEIRRRERDRRPSVRQPPRILRRSGSFVDKGKRRRENESHDPIVSQAHSDPTGQHRGKVGTSSPCVSNAYQLLQSRFVFGQAIGRGSFGTVVLANDLQTGRQVAIKHVLHDPRFKSRELAIALRMNHPNVVKAEGYFYSFDTSSQRRHLNLVMERMPTTLDRLCRELHTSCTPLDQHFQQGLMYYAFQLCSGLAYVHRLGVCHRDVKPQNVLVDGRIQKLKICDFGCAKIIKAGEPNESYICSRFYRAPVSKKRIAGRLLTAKRDCELSCDIENDFHELCLGARTYTTAVDAWSAGCVIAEMFIGRPLFRGHDAVGRGVAAIDRGPGPMDGRSHVEQRGDAPAYNLKTTLSTSLPRVASTNNEGTRPQRTQLYRIVELLGCPSPKDIEGMHASQEGLCKLIGAPCNPLMPLTEVLNRPGLSESLVDLVSKLLVYDPRRRLTMHQATKHPFFAALS